MKRLFARAVPHAVGETVRLQGFIDTLRDQKHVTFIMLRDSTGLVQIVCEKGKGLPLEHLTPESAITVIGHVVKASQVKAGGVEIQCTELVIESRAETPLPIASDSGSDKKLDWRFLSLRDPKSRLVFEIQTTMTHAMHQYWHAHGFTELHSPKLMGTASESGAEVFKVEYFDTTAYLAQSPQFYKQMAISAGIDKMFEIGPVFRAEPSFTTRHATEYVSVDMEIAWIDGIEDIMQLEEAWLQHVIQAVKDRHGDAITHHYGVDVVVPTVPFPRISLDTARAVLVEKGHRIAHKADLDPAGERLLSQHIRETTGHEFVFVTDYPAEVRAFYHRRHADGKTQSFDLLWKGLEITTGAMREHRVDVLKQQATEKGLSLEPLQHYIDFFRFGCPPHGGCGIGYERLLMTLLQTESIRDVTYLYRGPNRLTP